jgi:hypothetical protein
MSDMLDKMKDILDKMNQETPEEEAEQNTGPPLEEAVAHAINALGDIVLYGEYGRADSCATVARDALIVVRTLKEKYEEEVRIMEALRNTPEITNDN